MMASFFNCSQTDILFWHTIHFVLCQHLQDGQSVMLSCVTPVFPAVLSYSWFQVQGDGCSAHWHSPTLWLASVSIIAARLLTRSATTALTAQEFTWTVSVWGCSVYTLPMTQAALLFQRYSVNLEQIKAQICCLVPCFVPWKHNWQVIANVTQ